MQFPVEWLEISGEDLVDVAFMIFRQIQHFLRKRKDDQKRE